MPDASSHRPATPGWNEAFAALPLEAPPPGGWPRVAAALPAARRARWPAWAAVAAALALVAVVPLKLAQDDAGQARPVASADGEPTRPAPVARHAPAGGSDAATRAAVPVTASGDAGIAPDTSAVAAASGVAVATKPDRGAASAPTPEPSTALAATETGATNDASTARGRSPPTAAPAVAASASAGPDAGLAAETAAELERLYAESAQLEGLLALARGDGVANGAAAALAGELDARVADIDAALVQPSLSPARRIALWRERVDALRQAAAFESTQRLLAARGEQYDAMLVSID